ncbi:MAG: riboflavin synthase [Pseudomonadota bacterium]|nr:riboflavin synthase [Pseudomonadota bacterium]
MFTGIVSDIGQVIEMSRKGDIARLVVDCAYDAAGLALGASVANAGVCLTVVDIQPHKGGARLAFDVGAETLAVTTLGALAPGRRVNLERPLKIGDELGGHLVSGHVDGVAEIVAREDFEGMSRFRFRCAPELSRFVATKGSVALDGTSLTVNAVAGDEFETLLIPHTLAVTTWGERRAGDRVNLEVDQMARYAARLAGK